MKIKELKKIIDHLPDDMNVYLEESLKSQEVTLIEQNWGNHDGRYNMKCIECGWISDDLKKDTAPFRFCPMCSGKGKNNREVYL